MCNRQLREFVEPPGRLQWDTRPAAHRGPRGGHMLAAAPAEELLDQESSEGRAGNSTPKRASRRSSEDPDKRRNPLLLSTPESRRSGSPGEGMTRADSTTSEADSQRMSRKVSFSSEVANTQRKPTGLSRSGSPMTHSTWRTPSVPAFAAMGGGTAVGRGLFSVACSSLCARTLC